LYMRQQPHEISDSDIYYG